ncbi:MAG: glycosyltransferase family 4 protein [bacterium]
MRKESLENGFITIHFVSVINSRMIKALKGLSVFLYEQADKIVVVTEAFKEELMGKYRVPEHKISIVENGIETDEFMPLGNVQEIRKRFGFDHRFVVSYIGTIGYAHGLEVIIKAARIISDNVPEICFVLLGEGANKGKIKELIKEERLNNILVLDQVLRCEIPRFINASDVCLVLLRRAEIFKSVIPSKMLEFMACSRPIILGVDGQARKIMESANAGIYIEPENAQDLANAVIHLYNNPALCSKYDENGRRYIIKNFTRKEKAKAYLNIFNTLLPLPPPSTS